MDTNTLSALLEGLVRTALNDAYRLHEELGVRGEEQVKKNQFGDTALRMDVEAEEVVIRAFRDADCPVRIISEEHGQIDIGSNPRYLAVLDGLDGSNRYIAGRGKKRYGTMLGFFPSLDPEYGDNLVCGIMEHSTGKMFMARKDRGSFVISKNGEKSAIHASGRRYTDENTRIYVNQYWPVCKKFAEEKGLEFDDPRAYATYFSDLARGDVDVVITATGKGNLEPAIGYGLIAEAGGVLVSSNGESLGHQKYLEFGQKENELIIASSTIELARSFLQ